MLTEKDQKDELTSILEKLRDELLDASIRACQSYDLMTKNGEAQAILCLENLEWVLLDVRTLYERVMRRIRKKSASDTDEQESNS